MYSARFNLYGCPAKDAVFDFSRRTILAFLLTITGVGLKPVDIQLELVKSF